MKNYEKYSASSRMRQNFGQSKHGLDQIAQLKQFNSPYFSNARASEYQGERWSKYIPNDSADRPPSKTEIHSDHYRFSLERKLQGLFKEEREIIKERQKNRERFRNNDVIRRADISNKENDGQSFNIDQMERKIRDLEERYQKQVAAHRQKSLPKSAETQYYQGNEEKNVSTNPTKQKVRTEAIPASHNELLVQQLQECAKRQEKLYEQVQALKKSMQELRNSNEQLQKRVQQREQKKKHKQRSKELLHNIVNKLEFIQIQLEKSKRKQLAKANNKIEEDASALMAQFKQLKASYDHLSSQNKRIENRQNLFESKLSKIMQKKEDQGKKQV